MSLRRVLQCRLCALRSGNKNKYCYLPCRFYITIEPISLRSYFWPSWNILDKKEQLFFCVRAPPVAAAKIWYAAINFSVHVWFCEVKWAMFMRVSGWCCSIKISCSRVGTAHYYYFISPSHAEALTQRWKRFCCQQSWIIFQPINSRSFWLIIAVQKYLKKRFIAGNYVFSKLN